MGTLGIDHDDVVKFVSVKLPGKSQHSLPLIGALCNIPNFGIINSLHHIPIAHSVISLPIPAV
jgi:hypothetical protein